MSTTLPDRKPRAYAVKFTQQVWECTWHMGKTQQLFSGAVILILSTVTGIYFGVTSGNAWNVVYAVLCTIGVLFLLVLAVNIIRTPFILDRRRQEAINALELELDELKQGQTRNTQPPLDAKPTEPQKVFPQIECVLAEVGLVTYEHSRVERYRPTNSSTQPKGSAYIARFYSHPLPNAYSVNARAIITLTSVTSKKEYVVQHGVFIDHYSDNTWMRPSDFMELVIGFAYGGRFYICEHDHLRKSTHYQDVSYNFEPFDGDKLKVRVDFIGSNALGEIRTDLKPFGFNLTVKPEVRINLVKNKRSQKKPSSA